MSHPILLYLLIMFQWAPPQNLRRGGIAWSSCGPQLNRLASSGLDISHRRSVPVPYVQGVSWPSIGPIYLIALSKSWRDEGQTTSWFICRDNWLNSQKESTRQWRQCHGSHTRFQPQVQFNFILLLIQPKSVTSWNQPHSPYPPTPSHTHVHLNPSHCVSPSYLTLWYISTFLQHIPTAHRIADSVSSLYLFHF